MAGGKHPAGGVNADVLNSLGQIRGIAEPRKATDKSIQASAVYIQGPTHVKDV